MDFFKLEFSCNLKLLSQAVNNVCLIINKKANPMPVLEGILLECYSNKLKLTTFDLNLAIIKEIPVQSKVDGKIILNAQLFCEILKKLTSETVVIQTDSNLQTKILNSETSFQITGIDADKFPKIFTLNDFNQIQIKKLVFRNMIFQTLFAVSQITTQNPILCGSLFTIKNNMFKITSLDGYRIAISKRTIDTQKIVSEFVVSSKTLNELYKLLTENEEENEPITIKFNSTYASFETDGYSILTRLLEGQFLDYKNALPKETTTILTTNTKELATRIERVSIMVTNRISVFLKIKESEIELTCQSTLGNVKDNLKTSIEGEPIEKIAFNFKYMLDALKHTQCETIKIFFNGALHPIKIEPETGNDFMFLILPIRI